ncbi:histone-lysine N-methyltransferase SETMAR [Caerostris extrusa]|uniref:Histone-lysine N-methyltransferase SETMAR n=1 Tax=Caerostris extrusa TaxID=172846 RepID=A0AAV4RES2_CAEEX|nr:histone-lysine N-methyltransferase SETMAR [Caerostris extrusa]
MKNRIIKYDALIFVSCCQPLNTDTNKGNYRILKFSFIGKAENATKVANKICAIYGEGATVERIVRKWFASFKTRQDRPSAIDEDQIKPLIENNPRYMALELAEILKISKSTIQVHYIL